MIHKNTAAYLFLFIGMAIQCGENPTILVDNVSHTLEKLELRELMANKHFFQRIETTPGKNILSTSTDKETVNFGFQQNTDNSNMIGHIERNSIIEVEEGFTRGEQLCLWYFKVIAPGNSSPKYLTVNKDLLLKFSSK